VLFLLKLLTFPFFHLLNRVFLDEFRDALHAWGRLDIGTIQLQFLKDIRRQSAGREDLGQSFLVVCVKQLLVCFYQR
jgi:hypothetical protein